MARIRSNVGAAVGMALCALMALGGAARGAPATPSYAVTARIPGPDGRWDYVSFEPVKRRVYISRANGMDMLDVATGKLTPHFSDGMGDHEPLPLPGGRRVALTNAGTSSVRLLDTATGAMIADVPAGAGPDGATYDAATGLILVTSHSGVAALIDPKAKKQVGAVTIAGALEFPASDGKGRAYVDIESQNQIAVVDLKTQAVVTRYALPGCLGPSGLAYDAYLGVLIAACGNNVAMVISASTGDQVASLVIGKGPDAVFVDEGRRLAFIPCGRDGVLDVISLADPQKIAVTQTVTTQLGARTGAVDPKTGDVYLPTATYVLTAGRPSVTPGTFQILVVTPQ